MSRAFVKEDDQEEAPFIPPRAALPNSVVNYVTPNGMSQLYNEKDSLIDQREKIQALEDEKIRRHELAIVNGKLSLLEQRINSARVILPDDQPQNEIRFGAIVELSIDNKISTFQIVGADESNVKDGKIAFFSPIAKTIMGKKKDDKAVLILGKEKRSIEIKQISYLN
jgi:transcription elongation factor GreB